MPSHDCAGRHTPFPLSPGEISGAVSRNPRQPHRVRHFQPRAGRPQWGKAKPHAGRAAPEPEWAWGTPPPARESGKNRSYFSPGGRSRNGKYNSSPPRISPPRGSWGALDQGNWPAPPRKEIRHLSLMYMMRFHATPFGIGAIVGSRQARSSTVNRTDTAPSAEEASSDRNAGRMQLGQTW